jgi:quercetin dioxygenase-like cupin family protein
MQQFLGALPPGPGVISLAHFSLDPHTDFPNVEVPGPEIIAVLSGMLTVRITGEPEELQGLLTPAESSTAPAPKPATPEPNLVVFTLAPGDQLVVPANIQHDIVNDEPLPAEFLAVALTPLPPKGPSPLWPPAGIGTPALPPGVGIGLLDIGRDTPTAWPNGKTTIELWRATLAPGAVLATDEAGPVLLSATSDGLQLRLDAGDAVLVQTDGAATVRNTGTGPATLLLLAVTPTQLPANSAPATPASAGGSSA